MMVAPNSPRARAKASRQPARMPRFASGRVMNKKTRHSGAPRVRATCSISGRTSSMAARALRTNNGNDITDKASTTAFQVKTTSVWNVWSSQAPSGPRLPNRRSRTRPVTTGGRTSGRATNVSTSVLPGHCLRANSQPSATPGGRISAVPSNAIATENATIWYSSGLMVQAGCRNPVSCCGKVNDQSMTEKPNLRNVSSADLAERKMRKFRAVCAWRESLTTAAG